MPKITRADGPSYTDTETGEPVQGPVGMTVDPTVAGDAEVRTYIDEHGEVTRDTTDYGRSSGYEPSPDGAIGTPVAGGNVSADGRHDTDASPTDGNYLDAPDERYPRGQAGQFEPAEHNAQEVLDYLGGVGPDEQQRVLNAEAAGKNRSTITTSKYANAVTAPAADGESSDGDHADEAGDTRNDHTDQSNSQE